MAQTVTMPLTLECDGDDLRSIRDAIAKYQANYRWEKMGDNEPGVFLPEGDSDIAGAIVGEICRQWVEWKQL